MRAQNYQVLRHAEAKDKVNQSFSMGELQVDLPKTCVRQLEQLMALCKQILSDGKITYAEYLRLMKALEHLDRGMKASRRLQRMSPPAKSKKLKSPEVPGVDL
jgi:sugar diacid utilization regulator